MAASSSNSTTPTPSPLHTTPFFIAGEGSPQSETANTSRQIKKIQDYIRCMQLKTDDLRTRSSRAEGFQAYQNAEQDEQSTQQELLSCQAEQEDCRRQLELFLGERKPQALLELLQRSDKLAEAVGVNPDSELDQSLDAKLQNIAQGLLARQPKTWKTVAGYVPYVDKLYTVPATSEDHVHWKNEHREIGEALERLRAEEAALSKLFDQLRAQQSTMEARLRELSATKALHRKDWQMVNWWLSNDHTLLKKLEDRVVSLVLKTQRYAAYPQQRQYRELCCQYTHGTDKDKQELLQRLSNAEPRLSELSIKHAKGLLHLARRYLKTLPALPGKAGEQGVYRPSGTHFTDRIMSLPVSSIQLPQTAPDMEHLLAAAPELQGWVQSVNRGSSPEHQSHLSYTGPLWELDASLASDVCASLAWKGFFCHITGSNPENPTRARNAVRNAASAVKNVLSESEGCLNTALLLSSLTAEICRLQKELCKPPDHATACSLGITLLSSEQKKGLFIGMGPSAVLVVPSGNPLATRCVHHSNSELPKASMEDEDRLKSSLHYSIFDLERGDRILSLSPYMTLNLEPETLGLSPKQLLSDTKGLLSGWKFAEPAEPKPESWSEEPSAGWKTALDLAREAFVGAVVGQILGTQSKADTPNKLCLKLIEHAQVLLSARNARVPRQGAANTSLPLLGIGNSVGVVASLIN